MGLSPNELRETLKRAERLRGVLQMEQLQKEHQKYAAEVVQKLLNTINDLGVNIPWPTRE